MNSDTLKIFTLNISSLRKHYNELVIYFKTQPIEYDIIIITESWLYEDEICRYYLPGFTLKAQCRNDKRSGGVVVYVKENMQYNSVNTEILSANVIHLRFQLKNQECISIIGIYRFCCSNYSNFLLDLKKIISTSSRLAIINYG